MQIPTKIAVIIVTYQSEEHIQACLSSLLQAEPDRHLSLIVIDYASPDETVARTVHMQERLSQPRIDFTLIQNSRNLGFTRAVNQGLSRRPPAAAVLFLNPDTRLPAGSLATLLEKLYARPAVGVIAPQLRYPPSSAPDRVARHEQNTVTLQEVIQASCRRFPTYRDLVFEFTGLSRVFRRSAVFNRWKMGDFDHRSPREVDQPQGACLLARPEVVEQVGEWDENFAIFFSDVDWCRRVWQAGWKIRFEPEVHVYHAQGASVNQVRPKAIWSSHISFWHYFRKYGHSRMDRLVNTIAGPLFILSAGIRILGCYLRLPYHYAVSPSGQSRAEKAEKLT